MKRTPSILGIYFGLLAVMVIVMSWITIRTLRIEKEERLAVLSAEKEQLALWRIESMILPLILGENARDYSLLTANNAPPNAPILVRNLSPIICYFQSNSTGQIDFLRPVVQVNSRQGQQGNKPSKNNLFFSRILESTKDEAHLFATMHGLAVQPVPLGQQGLVTIVDDSLSPSLIDVDGTTTFSNGNAGYLFALPENFQAFQNRFAQEKQPAQQGAQSLNNSTENAFTRNFFNSSINGNVSFFNQLQNTNGLQKWNPKAKISASPMTFFWHDDQLLLARLIQEQTPSLGLAGKGTSKMAPKEWAQGCLIDWNRLKTSLISKIQDLLPEADLVPNDVGEVGNPLSLATIPVKLVPGNISLPTQIAWSPMQVSLLVAWGWLLLCALAIGMLLFGVIRLSERRAAFVSAVTHELRTPLTTFQLYSDLLANKETLTDEKQTKYVKTLQVESERLSHLVENVLSWSHLEQSSTENLIEEIDWTEFSKRIEPSLVDRAKQAGMKLKIADAKFKFSANRTAVERILFNLVDNSCKYAKHANNKQIDIDLKLSDSNVEIRVRDRGPGISSEIRSTLFQPFTKSATDAARSAAGVGLGLSLCQRLARQMKGDLTLTDTSPAGTTFTLQLPAC